MSGAALPAGVVVGVCDAGHARVWWVICPEAGGQGMRGCPMCEELERLEWVLRKWREAESKASAELAEAARKLLEAELDLHVAGVRRGGA